MAVRFSEVYLQVFEDESKAIRIYAFDWCDDTLAWKAAFTDPVIALGVWEGICEVCRSNLVLPNVDDLANNDAHRSTDDFSWLIADSREITEKNPLGIDLDNLKAHGSALFEAVE